MAVFDLLNGLIIVHSRSKKHIEGTGTVETSTLSTVDYMAPYNHSRNFG